MGMHEHTTSKETKIMSLGAITSSGDDQAAEVTMEELLESPSTAEAKSRKWAERPMVAVGVLTAVVAGSFAVGGFAGVLSGGSSAAASAGAGADRAAADTSTKARLDRADRAGTKGNGGDRGKDARSKLPSPSQVGLCRAYRSKVGDHPGKALESSAFTSLIKAADGAGNVPAYCVRVLAAKESAKGEGRGQSEGKGRGKKNGHDKDRDGKRGGDQGRGGQGDQDD